MFRSFWMGGFECATHRNPQNERLDMIAGTRHDVQAESDYALLKTMGIETARDGLRWHLIETTRGVYRWDSFVPMLEAANRQGIQVIWDVCHYGWPDFYDIFSPSFPGRFAEFARAAAKVIRSHSDDIPIYSPVNEISFFAWAAARTLMYPHAEGYDWEIKRQLIRCVVASVQAIRSVDSRARFIYPEPLIHVVPQPGRPDSVDRARSYGESQFEAWDMVAGYKCPELGGRPEYLDIVGCNFYSSNQWQVDDGARLIWDRVPPDTRWEPLHRLLKTVWNRYSRPLFLAETSHVGSIRPAWIETIGSEIEIAIRSGVPVSGICLYPIIDRYDWADPLHWHNSGLWDYERYGDHELRRVLNLPYAASLRMVQNKLQFAIGIETAKLGVRN